MIDFGKEEIFALTEVAAAIWELKSGKATGEDEIRLEMSKALNGGKVFGLTKVCQVAWELVKNGVSLKQVDEFKYLRAAFVSDER